MAYATVDELAAALRVTVTANNQAALQKCLDAAAVEIDHVIDAAPAFVLDPTQLPLVNRVNVVRGVEWWKANDFVRDAVANDPDTLKMPKATFIRHASALLPVKQQFGIG